MSQHSPGLSRRFIVHGKRWLFVFMAIGLMACGGSGDGGDPDEVENPQDKQSRVAVVPGNGQISQAIPESATGDGAMESPGDIIDSVQAVPATPKLHASLIELETRLQEVMQKQVLQPGDSTTAAVLNELLKDMLVQSEVEIDNNRLASASSLLAAIQVLDPLFPGTQATAARLAHHVEIENHLQMATTALQRNRYLSPADDNAVQHYRAVLRLDEENADAMSGLAAVQNALAGLAYSDIMAMDFAAAEAKLLQAERIYDPAPGEPDPVGQAQQQIELAREEQAKQLLQRGQQLLDDITRQISAGDFDQAELGLAQLIALGGYGEEVGNLRTDLQRARVYSAYTPGELIQDEFLDASLGGSIMVVIPAGSFFMGSTDTETDRFKNEGPVRRVVFERGFAIGQHELSIAEFAAFIAATGYVTDAEKKGNSRIYDSRSGMLTYRKNVKWNSNYMGRPGDDELPVLHVSWNDATEYARWLSRKTGKIYRLPSEAEFEYTLRAGNAARYWWGDKSPIETVTNITGDGDVSNNRRRWDAGFKGYKDGHWGPAPVRSFLPNPFGLYDMGGNVSEWTDDCWHGNYIHAPAGPEAWINPGCSRRVVRGGSWSSTPAQTRSAFRLSALPKTHGSLVGFRLVREL